MQEGAHASEGEEEEAVLVAPAPAPPFLLATLEGMQSGTGMQGFGNIICKSKHGS
jgi:hypothetical protein